MSKNWTHTFSLNIFPPPAFPFSINSTAIQRQASQTLGSHPWHLIATSTGSVRVVDSHFRICSCLFILTAATAAQVLTTPLLDYLQSLRSPCVCSVCVQSVLQSVFFKIIQICLQLHHLPSALSIKTKILTIVHRVLCYLAPTSFISLISQSSSPCFLRSGHTGS